MANVPISNLTTTWNNVATTFTGVKLNVTDTTSAAASLLMDLQVGGVSKFKVSKTGALNFDADTQISGSGGFLTFRSYGVAALSIGSAQLTVGNTSSSFGSILLQGQSSASVVLALDSAANTLAQRNGVNAQTFRLYNTFTDASNYERGFMRWNSNVLEIGAEKAGTGTLRAMRLGDASVSQATAAWLNVTFGSYAVTLGTPASSNLFLNPSDAVFINSTATSNVNLNQSSYGRNGVFYEPLTADINIGFRTNWGYEQAVKALRITGAGQWAAATTNLIGGHVFVTGGAGASASSGAANGGDVTIRGGTGYGTGRNGLIVMDNLPTSNPAVAGALWNNAGVLSVSAG